ncbi:type II secretion system F family protein [Jonesia denitrificans]|uniref:Type II secretion system protein n=1 Tax=Jonesia denitrificans (strain ATCC 14870 / DSM 20603 / BCRC 15368 / CIP 55.134 / JCM 11481 / NBRC 15587 / NCTC 10816 / Prevot 55134) TaxID=471856 RepID=C7R4E4_JONDD|nr:type II secretion system F family protein [Jonesia denitrificans]ACV09001.1 type II secretion system protein [Jonesia denitrificans DSM 20603]ASE09702.1 type II secretion system F family protein [Jonesia denitrificans]QXB44242.1 type II secretion system F family protein [Jonesia denitrificans]SQH21105.1 Cholera toxin secretion protein epsF [Jonesia denitrificans]
MAASDMKTYTYEAADKSGKIVKGKMEATSEAAVAQRLMANGGQPMSITQVNTGGLNSEISIPGISDKISLKEIAIMSRQLATMINAGLSLLRALTILTEQTENKVLQGILGTVRSDVETGGSLSSALAKHPKVFPPLMINMVRAGETGGFLDKTLLSIAKNFEDEVKLKGKIKSAMTYPVVVLVIAILASAGMLIFIVPVFAGMFATLGGELPFVTQILVTMSDFLKMAIWPILLLVFAGFIWWNRIKHRKSVREKVDPVKLKMPVFGKLTQKISIARFTRNLGAMLSAGVPILQALEIVGETSGNIVVEHAANDVIDSVRRGRALTAPLSENPVFPPMVVQMMAVGEDTGALDDMLEKIAEFYDAEVEATTEQLTSLIEPLMILVIGGIVGGMVIALYMPIFSIFNLIQ